MSYPFICYDTEDNSVELMKAGLSGFNKKITQIAAIKGNGEKFYNNGDVDEFLKWLEQQDETYLYAHNAQYDLGSFFRGNLHVLDKVLVGTRFIKAGWGIKTFVDTMNIWPMSAKKLGEAFGLDKLETTDMANDKDYVFRDVEIIWRAMRFAWKIAQEMGLEALPATLGGLCVKVWTGWGGENIHDSTAMNATEYDGERGYFYGGRVELFKQVNDADSIGYTDINSLYPSVMVGDFPGILEEMPKGKLPKHGIAKATVIVPDSDLTVLPYRDKIGRVLYPIGKFSGVWTVPELLYAESKGTKIIAVHECMGSNETFEPYKDFVIKLYEARLSAETDAEKLFFKLLMNNLYGRLGASGNISRTVWQNERNRESGIPYGEKILIDYKLPLSNETNWTHAAYVTAYGRIALHGYMEKIGASNMIYCDTDSTIFDCQSRKIPFATGSQLGEMKIEKACSKCGKGWKQGKQPCCEMDGRKPDDFWQACQTYAPKMYKLGSDYKAKGVPKRLAQEFIEQGNVSFDLPFKMRESIRFFDRDLAAGIGGRCSTWRKVTKAIRTNYDKKKLRDNRYFPCHVNDDELV